MDQKIIDKFWENVKKTNTCWVWTGAVNKNGTPYYKGRVPKFFHPKKVSLQLVGMDTTRLNDVFNLCGNKLCVNPDHLITTDEDRFWSKTVKFPDGCWEWLGQKDGFGYGKFTYVVVGKQQTIRAHQYSYLLAHKELPVGMVVRHACDNPACVRPDHLVLGTQADNIRDKVERNRQAQGEHHRLSKLTETSVREIRQLAANKSLSQLAKLYGVSKQTIASILSGKTWSHVK